MTTTGERRPSSYAARIEAMIEAEGVRVEFDVRHVEAYMRAGHPTLDGLSTLEFRDEVRLALMCIEATGRQNAEDLARSYGL